MSAVYKLRYWTGMGITHVVYRSSNTGPYATLCDFSLSPPSHRAVVDVGVPTCIRCVAREDKAQVVLCYRAR